MPKSPHTPNGSHITATAQPQHSHSHSTVTAQSQHSHSTVTEMMPKSPHVQREGFGFSVNSVTSASSCVTRTVELVAAGCVVSGA